MVQEKGLLFVFMSLSKWELICIVNDLITADIYDIIGSDGEGELIMTWSERQKELKDLIIATCVQVLEDQTMTLNDKLRAAEILSAYL